MIRRGLSILVIVHLVMFALQSCFKCDDKVQIVGLNSTSLTTLSYSPIENDEALGAYIINEPFRWSINTEQKYLALNNTTPFAAFAIEPCQPPENWINDLDSNTFKIYFNETFFHKQNTIRDSTNIHFLIRSNLSHGNQGIHEDFGFEFDSAFLEHSVFDTNLIYTLHFNGFTTDSVELSDSVRLSFRYL